MVPVDKKELGTPVHKAGTAAEAGVEICGYLDLNVRIVFVVSRAAAAAHSAARGESRQTWASNRI